ncbi:MAG: RecX family transcriptional regulator [Bacteroidales bacterium]|jgi:regulatory protein|nr:RecX family transcriptional regulator [Bacteroidales bacterium]
MERNLKSKVIKSVEDIEKIKRYCAYQERCLYDVRCKLKEWKVNEETTEWIVNKLVSEGYINEERFAMMFARGKFNIKSWGIRKIKAEMERRNINGDYIKKAIREIKQEDILEKLDKLACKWLKENPKGNRNEKKQKLFRYLVSKGYEQNDIWNCISKALYE